MRLLKNFQPTEFSDNVLTELAFQVIREGYRDLADRIFTNKLIESKVGTMYLATFENYYATDEFSINLYRFDEDRNPIRIAYIVADEYDL